MYWGVKGKILMEMDKYDAAIRSFENARNLTKTKRDQEVYERFIKDCKERI